MPQRRLPTDFPAFAALPIEMITADGSSEKLAVHIHGSLGHGRIPVVGLAGYHRNMLDLAAMAESIHRHVAADWPVVLIDFRGRGRSDDRRKRDYTSLNDAEDVVSVLHALGIPEAILFGQGYGGQVIMNLGASHPLLIAGAVLVDAGPVTDTRGLVRLRNNLRHIQALKGEAVIRRVLRKIVATDYPELADEQLDGLIFRAHFVDKRERIRPLFDPHLIKMLEQFEYDDVLVAQWPLFGGLIGKPLLLMRSQFSDQLRRETFDEMARRSPMASIAIIEGQGSPALFDRNAEQTALAEFIQTVAATSRRSAA